MKNITSHLLFPLLLLLLSPYSLFGSLDTYLHLKVVELDRADQPEFYGSNIIFTFESPKPVRSVMVIFEHEGYSIQHIYQCNDNGIFFFIYPIPNNSPVLKYRLVVDGLVMKDPTNPLFEQDLLGIDYSLFKITKIIEEEIINPQKDDNGYVRFVFKTRPGRIISLVGSFNDWDPYMHVLKEAPPGYYFISLRVAPGRYFYYFLIDGEKMLDLYNPHTGITSGGDTISYFDY
ncbi:MAG: hypothetical protein JXB88_06870 [Spirochaetales bacterium]|nr:hypothetical protein [Spirochaetales bacterium]